MSLLPKSSCSSLEAGPSTPTIPRVLHPLWTMCDSWTSMHLLLHAHSVVSDSAVPWTVACQAPLPMEFYRQECWGGLPFPTAGNLPEPGIEPTSPALAGRSITTCFWPSLDSCCPSSLRTYPPFSPLEELLLILQYPSSQAKLTAFYSTSCLLLLKSVAGQVFTLSPGVLVQGEAGHVRFLRAET